MLRYHRIAVAALSILLALGLLIAPQAAHAQTGATITVNTTADENDATPNATCSLREAITSANNNANYGGCVVVGSYGDDIIVFSSLFNSAQTITLGSSLPIISTNMTITGSGQSLLTISGNNLVRVFEMSGGTVIISNVTIANGWLPAGAYGAGISKSGGTLTVTSSTFSGNTSTFGGGGIFNFNGALTVSHSTFSGNTGNGGGGIYNSSALTVSSSTFSGNVGLSSGGGAIYQSPGGALTLTNSTFRNNTSNFSNAGDIITYGAVTVTNSTFSSASIADRGGITGLNPFGTLVLTVNNSIFSNSLCSGTTGGVNNVATPSSGCPNIVASAADLNLGPLANNGGTTQTIALLSGSVAIDAGNNTICAAAPVNNSDQRNYIRPAGAACDAGAYEANAVIPPTVTIAAQDANAAEGGVDNGTFRITRAGATTAALTVNFTVGGTATSGTDYTAIGTSAIIPIGQSFVDVTLTALNDSSGAEPAETVIATLAAGTGYTVGAAPNNTATVTIAANGFLVNTNADTGVGSLRQAIQNANDIAGTDTITFDATYFGTARTFTLTDVTGALPTLTESVTITGPGAGFATISGSGLSARMLTINSGVTATISGLTFANGSTGAIRNSGSLSVSNSTFNGNTAASGGGIESIGTGTLTVTGSTFTSNGATGTNASQGGGAVFVSSTTSTITNSTFSSNTTVGGSTGGAVLVNGGALTVNNSTFNSNTGAIGGGIRLRIGTGTVNNSIFVDSTCGGALTGTFNITTASSNCPAGDSFTAAQINLGALANNGGPTQTFALLSGSVAIDAGSNTLCAAAPVNNLDQRGTSRPIDGDSNGTAVCDVGAYEAPLNTTPPPTVTIAAQDANAAEGGVDNGTFRITRTGGTTTSALTVNFTVGGTATSGTDYTAIGTSAIIPIGQTFVDITLTALNDSSGAEPAETVIATLAAGTGYTVGAAPNDTATVTIAANGFLVTTASDTVTPGVSTEGMLRQAINNANAIAGTDTITFSALFNSAQTITLAGALSDISTDMTIDGPGASLLTISGNSIVRVFNVTGGTVTIQDVTITRGYVSFGEGGGILNSASLTVRDSVVSDNISINRSGGGGIYNVGTLTVIGSEIKGNNASNTNGGGIHNVGTLMVINSTFSNNTAFYGGGIINLSAGTTTVIGSSFTSNSAALGGGGALFNQGVNMTVSNSTFNLNNTTGFGGAISTSLSGTTLTVFNSTFVGNSATSNGGAILANQGTVTVTNSTFSGNLGTAAILGVNATPITLNNSLLVNTTCAGVVFGSNNVTTSGSGCPDGDSFTAAQINLGPLQNNGGPTQTMALIYPSVAIDAGDNTIANNAGLLTDQRGAGFPRILGGTVDAGAYEVTPAPSTVTISAQTATAIEGGANGVFRISRGTDTAGDLTVNFTKGGTATDGSDYTLGTSAIIPDGATFVDVTLTATDDAPAEADETVILTLATGTGYTVGTAPNNAATVTIARNDVVVTNSNDSGEGSLRQAVENALIFGGSPTITFSGVSAPIVLSNPVTISGGLTIDGGSTITVETANDSFRAFTVTGGTVLLRSFIINGGGIEANGGNLTLGNSPIIITGNNTTVCGGGLLVNGGTVTLQAGSQINGNTTTDNGGGICVTSGSLIVTGSGTQVNGNSATLGGGIYVSGGSVTVQSGAAVSSNVAGGGIHQAGGDVTVTDSFVQQNTGGAIAFASSGTRTVTNTCIVLNTDTAVTFAGGAGVIATNNWWGTVAGPFSGLDTPTPPNDDNTSGSYGDSVTPSTDASVFDYSGYQTVAPSGCFVCSVPSALGGIDRASRICLLNP